MRNLPFFTAAVLASSLSLASGRVNAQIVTTFAGTGAEGSADGPGEAAAFSGPAGVAVGPTGLLYVADTRNARIRKVTPDGSVTTFKVFAGEPEAYPVHPASVAVDALGDVWEADPVGDGIDGGTLLGWTPDGKDLAVGIQLLTSWPTLEDPVSVATDQVGNLYVTTDFSRVLRFDSKGVETVVATGVNAQGVFAGVAVDATGNLYLADTVHNRIVKLSPQGNVSALIGSGNPGSADGQSATASFLRPIGITVDGAGFIYVADSGNNKIRRITPGGVVETLAGTGVRGSTDGEGSAATFDAPSGVALDAAGNLYVADSGNNKIRKISGVVVPCSVGCTNWIVPSLAHTAGADGSFWTSDLVLHNRGAVPVPVTLKFLGNSRDGTSGPEKSVMLDPFATVTYSDVLSSVFGITGDAGALEVLAPSDQVTVRSRTFTASGGGTVGDGLPGVRQGTFFTDQTSPSPVLTGLREDGAFRSNLVLVNGTALPLVVHVAAADASGAPMGSRDYTLPPLGMIQDSRFLTRDEFGGGGHASGVTVTLSSTTPGASFAACATVIDNGSNAPTTVLPQ